MHQYFISTGFAKTRTKKFKNERTAWNYLAKELDSVYKTGGKVIGYLHEIKPVPKLHALSESQCDWCIGVPICVGYIALDYDGNPWNNPVLCVKCCEPMTAERSKVELCCEPCQKRLDQGDDF